MKKYHLLTVLIVLSVQPIHAAEFCVTSSAGLQTALNSAASNSQHDVIKIAEGSYTTPGAEFSYYGVNSWDLEISGGWSEFFGNPCGQQLSGNAFATTLDGNTSNRVLRIRAHGTADIKISGLMIANGLVGNTFRGGGLYVYSSQNDHLGNITIEKTAYLNNEAEFGGAISLSGGHRVILRNNLFAANHSLSGHTVSIVQNNSYGVYFTNNTMILNDTDSGTLSSGLRLYISGSSQSLIANNILYDNENFDLTLAGSGNHHVYNNNIGVQNGVAPWAAINNFSLPNRFDSGILNFTPSNTSPLVNNGTHPCSVCPIPVPFDDAWGLGLTDMEGDTRVLVNRVDIGAFESPYERDLIFWNGVD